MAGNFRQDQVMQRVTQKQQVTGKSEYTNKLNNYSFLYKYKSWEVRLR